jgi:hypothetical protein
MISGDALTVLGSMFNVDSHKSITVGGLKLGLHLPLIDSFYVAANSRYNHFNTKAPGRFYFNPFLESHNQLIPPAKYDDGPAKLQWLIWCKAINFLHGMSV